MKEKYPIIIFLIGLVMVIIDVIISLFPPTKYSLVISISQIAIVIGILSYSIISKTLRNHEESKIKYKEKLLRNLSTNKLVDTPNIDNMDTEDSNKKKLFEKKCILNEDIYYGYDVITLMVENMSEINDYFVISKKHATRSFWLAFFASLFGLILFILTVVISFFNDNVSYAIITAISGAFTEIFSVTIFIIHKKSTEQLNFYYKALHENEKLLLSINILKYVTPPKRDDLYEKIIEEVINSIVTKA